MNRNIATILLLSILLSSCLSQKPIVGNETLVTHDIKKVTPEWKYKENAFGYILVGLGFAGLGAAMGPVMYPKTKTVEGAVTGGAFTGLGFAWLIVGNIAAPKIKRKLKSTDPVEHKELDKWLRKYNRYNSTDFVFLNKTNPTPTLVRSRTYKKLQDYKQKCLLATDEIYKSNMSLAELSKIEELTTDDFSVFFPTEINILKTAITNETEGALEKVMQGELAKINTLPTSDLQSLTKIDGYISQFRNQYQPYLSYNPVWKTLESAKSKKSEVISNNLENLKQKVEDSNSLSNLKSLKELCLEDIKVTSDTRALESAINQKIRTIEYNIRQAQIAKEEEERRAEERRKVLAEQQRIEELRQLMNETTPTGEPTEAQMKWAVNYQIQAKSQRNSNLANIDAQEGTTAILKLFGMAMSGTEYRLASFEKYGCLKAEGKPGYACDYVAKTNVRGGLLDAYFGGLINSMSGAEIETARFAKVDGIWMLVEYMD